MKSLLGVSNLAWDPTKKTGAYEGQAIYDHDTMNGGTSTRNASTPAPQAKMKAHHTKGLSALPPGSLSAAVAPEVSHLIQRRRSNATLQQPTQAASGRRQHSAAASDACSPGTAAPAAEGLPRRLLDVRDSDGMQRRACNAQSQRCSAMVPRRAGADHYSVPAQQQEAEPLRIAPAGATDATRTTGTTELQAMALSCRHGSIQQAGSCTDAPIDADRVHGRALYRQLRERSHARSHLW
eukprot:TRINITY_DN552_c0_g1_i3.p1 TRINITY_DN552_c0_g1~~TRINITY_DN552_c0_g1_i3.p1  ORF type:complete len:238 (+),score=34.12 TRINITY_DN552_c0_g1_i3:343-1056(+)